jgi:hypothetical protein
MNDPRGLCKQCRDRLVSLFGSFGDACNDSALEIVRGCQNLPGMETTIGVIDDDYVSEGTADIDCDGVQRASLTSLRYLAIHTLISTRSPTGNLRNRTVAFPTCLR